MTYLEGLESNDLVEKPGELTITLKQLPDNGICSFISAGWESKLQRAASRLLLTKPCQSNTDGCW